MRKRRRKNCSDLDDEFYFDKDAADQAVEFIEKLLRHWQGEWAGKSFILLIWEREIIRDVFGWKRRIDGTRRYRSVYIEIPKKNGKSMLAAAIALLLLFLDAEPGAEIYSAAGDKKQASIVFQNARNVLLQSRPLRKRSRVLTRRIIYPKSLSWYEAVSADADTKHGFNPHGIVFDELHVQPNFKLWDTMRLGMAARRQPLLVSITTAGIYDEDSLCWTEHRYAIETLKDPEFDRYHYAVIYSGGKDPEQPIDEIDWTSPRVWKRANPSLGVTLKKEFLEKECNKAQKEPAYISSFQRLHLDLWPSQVDRAIDMDQWRAADSLERKIADGAPCYIGIDLSSKLDLTSVVALFPHADGTFSVDPYFWIPEENLDDRKRRDGFDYPRYVKEGLIETTPGNWIDQEAIRKKVNELGERYDVRQVGYDSWNASQMATWLQDEDGFEIVEIRQGYKTMSEPCKTLVGYVKDRRLRHGGNKVLAWNANNLSFRKDPNDNWAPQKSKKGTTRIDGIVATLNALSRALLQEDRSVYEDRGVRSV